MSPQCLKQHICLCLYVHEFTPYRFRLRTKQHGGVGKEFSRHKEREKMIQD